MTSRLFIAIFLCICSLQLLSQASSGLHPPLDIPLFLSGNFGELRQDHFHSGIDIKTGGNIGQRVYSIENGHVSRIKIQAMGYGKSIYLSHPDGTTSVYCHLDHFRDDIASYVKKIQYGRKEHEVDIYLKAGEFPINKGDLIAWSGNSGSSQGPHLHLEIRKTAGQHPTNVLRYGLDIKDEIPPRFVTLGIRPLHPSSRVNGQYKLRTFEAVRDQGIYSLPWGTGIEAGGEIGLSVEVYDYLDGTHNRCGIYTLEAYVNDRLWYSHVMNEFSFSTSRYINAHMEYSQYISGRRKMHRLYRLPNNRLSIYGHLENEGKLDMVPGQEYNIRIVATDVAGNRSQMEFSISGLAPATGSIPMQGTLMLHQEENDVNEDVLRMHLPPETLYEDQVFSWAEAGSKMGLFSRPLIVHSEEYPVQRKFDLWLRLQEDCPAALRNKLLLARWDREENCWISEGGNYKEGWVGASVRNFGTYGIALDTIAPNIVPEAGSESGDLRGNSKISYTVTDEFGSIDKYEGYIDDRWVLFEYDPKNDLLSYEFDSQRLGSGKDHKLELYVRDDRGNVRLYHHEFYW